MVLYGRRISVSVAGLLVPEDPEGIPPPRITVAMERQADETQTTGTVAIYNLSPGREAAIYERRGPIQVEAGYPDTIASIFEGQVQRVRRPRQNLARITIIELGDMVRDAGRTGAVSSRSYDGPVTARQLATDFVADMGLTVGPLDAIPAGATRTDFAWAGPSGAGLTVALSPFNVRWFEDDGVIRFRRGMPQPDAPTVTISPETGLVGSPLSTDEGAECTMFLNPQAKVGGVLALTSEALSGSYRIVGLRHDADNWSGPFTTWVDLREL